MDDDQRPQLMHSLAYYGDATLFALAAFRHAWELPRSWGAKRPFDLPGRAVFVYGLFHSVCAFKSLDQGLYDFDAADAFHPAEQHADALEWAGGLIDVFIADWGWASLIPAPAVDHLDLHLRSRSSDVLYAMLHETRPSLTRDQTRAIRAIRPGLEQLHQQVRHENASAA